MQSGIGEDQSKREDAENAGPLWHCERCNKHYDRCHWTWNFTVKLGDQSDLVYAQCLGDYPGTDIIGMTAGELRSLAESDPNF